MLFYILEFIAWSIPERRRHSFAVEVTRFIMAADWQSPIAFMLRQLPKSFSKINLLAEDYDFASTYDSFIGRWPFVPEECDLVWRLKTENGLRQVTWYCISFGNISVYIINHRPERHSMRIWVTDLCAANYLWPQYFNGPQPMHFDQRCGKSTSSPHCYNRKFETIVIGLTAHNVRSNTFWF